MTERWFDDKDRLRTFIFALQNKMQKIYDRYWIDMNDWKWIERNNVKRSLVISGDLSGETTCGYNQRDVDDWDEMDIDFDTEIEIGTYDEEHLSTVTKQQFFKEAVKDLISEIEWHVKNEIEDACGRMDEEAPDRYRD